MTDRAWQALAEAVAGDVVRPGAAAYDGSARPAIARFADAHPAAIVRCADAAGRRRRARLRPLGAAAESRCAAAGTASPAARPPRASCIDVSPLRSVTRRGRARDDRRRARGSATSTTRSTPTALTIPAGCGPTVGIAGLTLGGGLGILGRLHGLTSDQLRAARGRARRRARRQLRRGARRDLFWALRGAGGARFGVVTSLVFATVAAPPATAFELRSAPATRRADRRLAGLGARRAGRAGREPAGQRGRRARSGPRDRGDGRPPRRRPRGGSASSRPRPAPRRGRRRVRPGPYREAKRFLSGLGDGRGRRGRIRYSKSEFFARSRPAA